MSKSFFSSLIIISLFLSAAILAQESSSLQINGSLIYPKSGNRALGGFLQFNYPINQKFELYAYSGYSAWDKNKVIFREDPSTVQQQQFFMDYSADDLAMIPIFVGGLFNFHKNKMFTSFVNFEVGYSYFSYNSYKNLKSVNPNTGEVTGYYIDGSTKEEITENLLGIGLGAGLSHPMTENANLIFAFRLNSYMNSDEYGFFSREGTYTMLIVGIDFAI